MCFLNPGEVLLVVQSKIEMLSSFTHTHDFLTYAEPKRYFKERW